ncbi:phage major capsid protein [Streptomyces sp. CAI-85]|uniref:phage major capsid protein n=1 Tax=Streptomyces sp. CAI-85 TaxID=1472662 RepID=UPI0015874F7C|nr:phage major capsid protein [Streptomyces sp. CAI-85]NUV63244.1 phage major capsid protein [Streptomyces sp. CAI-85]
MDPVRIPTLAELREQYTDLAQLEEAASIAVDRHGAAIERLHIEAGTADLTASQQRAYDAHSRALVELREFVAEQRQARLEASRSQYGGQFAPGAPPAAGAGLSEVRQRALRLVDDEVRMRGLDSAAGDRMEALIRADSDDVDGELVAQRTLLTMNRHYRTAFRQLISERNPMLTDDEIRAVRAVRDFERRAMAIGTPSTGGFAVPVIIDPTMFLTAQGLGNPVYALARVEVITNDTWRGLTTAGVTWQWNAEAAATTDNAPSLAQPEIPTNRADGFIPFSIEAGSDIVDFEAQMMALLASGYTDLVGAALTTGLGASNQPTGIVTALDANTNAEMVVTTGGTIGGLADIARVWAALPARARNGDRVAWMSSVSVRNQIQALSADNGEGNPVYSLEGGMLYDRPYVTNEHMAAMPTGTAAANMLVVGDFSGYVVAQRAGMSIEPVSHLFDVTNNRPTGQRGLFAWARIGADSIDDTRFRLLQNKT